MNRILSVTKLFIHLWLAFPVFALSVLIFLAIFFHIENIQTNSKEKGLNGGKPTRIFLGDIKKKIMSETPANWSVDLLQKRLLKVPMN